MSENTNNIQNFKKWIKTIAIYLGQFTGSNKAHGGAHVVYTSIDNIEKYDGYILKKYMINSVSGYWITRPNYLEFVCVAGNDGQSDSQYVSNIIENIFPIWCACYPWELNGYRQFHDTKDSLCYNSLEMPYDILHYDRYANTDDCIALQIRDIINHHRPSPWRDDLKIPDICAKEVFDYSIKKLAECDFHTRAYCIFWNIFLLAIDDEIYDKQISDVMSLAQKVGFNEAMMRDWCRAVEYVMAGNMFSEDCDFQCETYEGKIFFLHQE